METDTMDEPTNFKQQFLNILSAGILLISGFFISLFLLATSIILLPFAIFKISQLKRQYEDIMSNKNGTNDESIIEGEYTVKEENR